MQQIIYKCFALLCTVFFIVNASAQVVINEYSASNLSGFPDNYDKFEDWIEIYNPGASSIDLGGYGLSDDPNDPLKWVFPENSAIESGGFIRVWVSGRDEYSPPHHYHASFKLSQTKDDPEYVVLSDYSGNVIDSYELEITQKEHSRGRITDGAEEWAIFTNPTPRESNSGATGYSHYAMKPQASMPAGFYEGGVIVTLSTDEPDSEIRYTTNGNEPTLSSQVYSSPITVDETTIVKARTFSSENSVLPGLIEFNTYFIDENHTLAIMSLSAADLDNLLNGNQSLRPFGTFEYFNAAGERTTFGYGEFNKHGQDSWVHDQRSIDYIARDECGYNYTIREPMIPLTDRDEFQRIILRAAGDDNYPGIDTSAHLRDYFVQNTSQRGGLHLDVRKGQKGIIYVNGQYWGIYGFREKVDDHDFTEYYYDQDKYNIYFLKLWGGTWAEYGGQAAFDDWNNLHDFIKFQDMTDNENWEYVKSRYDYKSLVDYVHINSFVVCSDWINWNVGWWRGLNPEGGHQKWGYILWDEDATFAHYINYTGVPGISPYTSPCYPEGLSSDPQEHILALNKLRANPDFDQYYISRYIDLYNTVFHPEEMIPYLDSIEDEMTPEMPRHINRWGGDMLQWKSNVQKIKNFITARHNYLPDGLSSCWNLSGPFDISVSAEPEFAGGIQFNSLQLTQFPFEGEYFGGIDIKIGAIELNPNYEFDYWELNNHTVYPDINTLNATFQLTESDVLVAHFKEKLFVDSLVINEINYNSSDLFDTEDWVEFYNPHLYDLEISGWKFKDDNDDHEFVFPENTIVESDGYLVLCRDTASFFTHFPGVENVYGNMDFGFNGSGELIRLFNEEDVLIDTVHYLDETPWPTEPDGNGPTLELILPHYDNALAESWMASPDNGTPGAINSYWLALPENPEIKKQPRITISPNPMNSTAQIEIHSAGVSNGILIIYNTFGKIVRTTTNITSNRFTIGKQNLEKGMYLLKFTDTSSDISVIRKLIIN
jgi:hypothetical protein